MLRKFTALQYAMFMVAALAVLVAVPSAYAATVTVDASCSDKIIGNGQCRDAGIDYHTLWGATRYSNPNDIISVSSGTYDKEVHPIRINHALTIQPASASDKVTVTGRSSILVASSDVTIKGITFANTTRNISGTFHPAPVIAIANGMSDVTIHNNTFRDTHGHGIRIQASPPSASIMDRLHVTDNLFRNIGTFAEARDGRADTRYTAIHLVANHANPGLGLNNSKITGNTIDTTTYAGINLGNAENTLVANNTISNVPEFAIQVALGGKHIKIHDNQIYNANYDAKVTDATPDGSNRGAIVLWAGGGLSHVTVINNTISGGNTGIVYCPGTCGVDEKELADARKNLGALNSARNTDETNLFTGNTFHNVGGFNIVNYAVGTIIAIHNYYGEAEPDFAAAISGLVQYSPYYADYVGGELRAMGPVKQHLLADIQRTDICSIGLERYNLYFDDAAWGAESSAEANAVLNTGDIVLTGVKIQTDGWLDEKDNPVDGAKTTVADRLVGNFLDLLSTNADGIDMNANLPAPDTDEKLDLQFTLDLTGKATGPDSQIRETISFAGSCS